MGVHSYCRAAFPEVARFSGGLRYGHRPESPGDFTSVEQTADEITAYLKERGVSRLDAAYGCSLGGACLTRTLALVIIEGLTMYLGPI